jgi:hypothetical protein
MRIDPPPTVNIPVSQIVIVNLVILLSTHIH